MWAGLTPATPYGNFILHYFSNSSIPPQFMVVIRLSRVGKKSHPTFRIIASDKQKDTVGSYLELLDRIPSSLNQTALRAVFYPHKKCFPGGGGGSFFSSAANSSSAICSMSSNLCSSVKRDEIIFLAKCCPTRMSANIVFIITSIYFRFESLNCLSSNLGSF